MDNNIEESREFKAAKELENALNDCGFKNSNFTAAIPTFHKTLEQNFMRLIVSCIRFMADDKGGAPLLGLKGLVVKIHGNSKDREVQSAILQCRSFIMHDVNGKILEAFSEETA